VFSAVSEKFIQNEIKSDDPGLIIYTSGTTGKPKGAILTQKNLIHDARTIINIWEITDSDVLCHALPLFHIHGLCFALHTALMAGSVVLMLDEFSPDWFPVDLFCFFDKKPVDDSALQRGADDTSLQILGSVCHGGLEVLHPCKGFIKLGLGR